MKSLFHMPKNSHIATVFLTLFALKSILVFQRFHSYTEILREQTDIDSWKKVGDIDKTFLENRDTQNK